MRPDVVKGNVFVANLPLGFTDEQLAELFDPYGIVLRAYLARDPTTGEPTGHGLVELAPEKVVDTAIEAVSAERPGGRRVDVRRADASMGITVKRPARAARPPRAESGWDTPRPPRRAEPIVVYERDPWSRSPRTGLRSGPKA
jgi:RNA recognition motif-containing protein